MITTWKIRTLCPSPSMSETKVELVGTYSEAVAACHASWMETHRRTSVEWGMTYYHTVDRNGLATDKNTYSGIPATQQL